jgi:hypothetical protein
MDYSSNLFFKKNKIKADNMEKAGRRGFQKYIKIKL